MLYLSSLILRCSVPLLCISVKSLNHLKDAKPTPEFIDAHSFTNVSIPENILMLPARLTSLFDLQVLRLLSSLLENLSVSSELERLPCS